MSNKPHLRPQQRKRQAKPITKLLVAILILAIFALGIALAASGRVAPHGRFIPLCGRMSRRYTGTAGEPASYAR